LNAAIHIDPEGASGFQENGYLVVRQVLDQPTVEEIKRDIHRLLQDAPQNFRGREINTTSDGQVNSIHDLSQFMWSRRLLENPLVRRAASTLLNDEAEDFGSELFAKPSGTGVPVPDHQDDYYWCISDSNALTFWFAIARSDQESGAVYYYPGSHRCGLKRHVPSGVPGSSQRIAEWSGIDQSVREIPILEPGDCVIHHALTVHGSGPNTSGNHRLGLTVRFKGATSTIDRNRKDRYLTELKLQLESRGQE